VIEIWNNVFIQYNRLKDGTLEPLPAAPCGYRHGLRAAGARTQGKKSNYDTDVFSRHHKNSSLDHRKL
jgi:alanyl-tRNA synthetase